jgi:adenylate kinase family enzyme/YHS domain-containing protein
MADSIADALRCMHFPIANGLTPSIEELRDAVDKLTCDWEDESIGARKKDFNSQDPYAAPNFQENPQVQAAVMRLWGQFQKDQQNSIGREEYEGFMMRVMRVLLPGLGVEREQRLAVNAWEEDACGLERMQFAAFLGAMVSLARVWTDWRKPDDASVFLEDLLRRTTRVLVTIGDTGAVIAKAPNIMATFYAHQDALTIDLPESDFGSSVTINPSGALPKCTAQASFDANAQWVSMGPHLCWFDEMVVDPEEDAAPNDGMQREWIALDDVIPLGRTALVALMKAQADASKGLIDIDVSGVTPAPDNMIDAARITLQKSLGINGQVSVEVAASTSVAEARAISMPRGTPFGISDLLAAGLSEASNSTQIFFRPTLRSPLYKLRRLREELQLEQPSPAEAVIPGGAVNGDPNGPRLPSFLGLLEGKVAVDSETGLVKPVKNESLLLSATLTSLAQAFLYEGPDSRIAKKVEEPSSIASEMSAARHKHAPPKAGSNFVTSFLVRTEGLENDASDFMGIAKTPPVTLWVFGQCDSLGDYKSEVCRRLADKLGLQWLKPQYLLELAVGTPERFRSPLMARCVEQLQRGMVVPTSDALRLALEFMASAKCKTNGYILDFPPIIPSDRELVTQFIEKLREVSSAPEIRMQEFLRDDVQLPPLTADPPPPKPEPDPADDAEGGAAADDAEAAEPAGEDAEAEVVAEQPAEEVENPVQAAEDLSEDNTPPPPPEEPVPNPWVNSMPRRFITLEMRGDELAGWRLELLKARHADRELLRKQRLEAGEEDAEEDEEEEPAEELPVLPEDEDELNALFSGKDNDVLLTMASFIRKPSLKAPAPNAKPPPIPDASMVVKVEEVENKYAKGESSIIKHMHETRNVPMLSLHADGRDPETMVGILEATSGEFQGPRVSLPQPIEDADSVADLNELLVKGLDEKQASRRWSRWQQHCPVSLHEKSLTLGQKEFAVDYAGNCLLFADEKSQHRFCTWPKAFLTESPTINSLGMALGYVLLSPGGFRAQRLADRLRETYGFDIVNVPQLLDVSMQAKAIDAPVPEAVEGEEPVEAEPLPEGVPGLYEEEKKELCAGKAVGTGTIVRIIGDALKIRKNIESVAERKRLLDQAKADLEAAADNEEAKAALGFEINAEGEPIINYPAELNYLRPSKGFVIVGYPETGEQLAALQDQLQLKLERILLLKKDAENEDAPEVADFLADKGFDEEMPLATVLEKYEENIATLEAAEAAPARDEIALHADEDAQLVAIRKKIDPFYPVIEDPSVAIAIPDPDEFNMDDAVAAAAALEEETGEKQDPPEAPVIPWGLCGGYCPVTLAEDFWLYPGSKELQCVFRNRVYSLASEAARDALTSEPIKYIPSREPTLPPPRILITGPLGSGVDEQCQKLSEAYGIPVIELEDAWRRCVDERIEKVKQGNRQKKAAENLVEPMIGDSGPVLPDGWSLPKEKVEGEDEEDAPAEDAEPEEDGLDDDAREQLLVEAMRDVLGRHNGACVINGKFKWDSFGQVDPEGDADPSRSLQNLLVKARRLPDLTFVLKAKHDVAARNVYDFDEINRAYEERLQAYMKKKQEAEEAQERGDEDVEVPEPPEDLVIDAEEGEKESDRVKVKFIEKKLAQQTELQGFVEAIVSVRAPLQKVSSDRGAVIAHKSIRWHCKPFMEERASLLAKQQARKLTPSKTADVLQRALAQASYLGDNNPMASDAPLFVGKPDALAYGVEFRGRCFYPRSAEERESFLAKLRDFTNSPIPSPISVHPCISINGPPLSGKTTLAKALANRTGAVYLSMPDIISALCNKSALPFALSRDIVSTMREGKKIPQDALIAALRHRVAAPDVLQRGWILDDFPITKQIAQMLTEVGIVPHRVITLTIPESVVFERAMKIGKQAKLDDVDLVQNEVSLQRQRLNAFMKSIPLVNSYYSLTFNNVRELDGTASVWATEDRALEATSRSISQRFEYYRCTAYGKAACIYGLNLSPGRVQKNESAWRRYCPVALTLGNELVLCKDSRYAVEYKSRIYWLSSAENMRLFLDDPESFLAVPLPDATPHRLPLSERVPPPRCMLEPEEDGTAFCPVALVDRKEMVKAAGCYIVQFQGKYWSMESKKSCDKFMRRPMRYVPRAKLPAKKPALPGKDQIALLSALTQRGQDGKGLQPAEMLTFMQASVAEIICQALVEAGERRPLLPGKSPQESSLLFLARFLRAKNCLNTEMTSAEVQCQLDKILSDCGLPNTLKEFTQRKETFEKTQEGVWTCSDSRQFQEMCKRFDTLFKLR